MRQLLKKFYNSSITRQIMIIVMGAVSFILCLGFLFFLIFYVYRDTRQTIADGVDMVARTISGRIPPVMIFKEEQEAKKVISEAAKIKDSVILVCLYTNQGGLLTGYDRGNNKKTTCPSLPPEQKGFIYKFSTIALNQDVLSPNGDKVASYYIVSDTRQVREKFISSSIGILIFLSAASTICYLAVRKAKYVITRPILNLVRAAEAVKHNNYSVRATKIYNNEVGILADSFNGMLNEVQLRDMELKQSNEQLEEAVRIRTIDLQSTIEQREKAYEDLEHATKLKEIWIANIGHEIRTPVHGILQVSKFIIDELGKVNPDIPSVINFATRVHKAAIRQSKLIEGLLDFSKLSAGKTRLIFKENDIYEIAKDLVDELNPQIAKKEADVVIHEPSCQTNFIFDKGGIEHIITNIIGNAVKFSPQGGKVEVFITNSPVDDEHPDGVSVSVKDYGVGIPESELEEIFDTFNQSSKTYDGSGGTGLGLSIAREMVLLHRGRIFAKNNEGESGATFTFIIPREQVLTPVVVEEENAFH